MMSQEWLKSDEDLQLLGQQGWLSHQGTGQPGKKVAGSIKWKKKRQDWTVEDRSGSDLNKSLLKKLQQSPRLKFKKTPSL